MDNLKIETPPLEGVRVIEMGSAVFGPYTSQQLGDYGAEVIKIEPIEGDPSRFMGPSPEQGMAATFMGVNRGKHSIALNMRKPEAREIVHRIIGSADVFLHNMRPSKAAQLGFAPEALRETHPRLIFAGLHGFLQDGPYDGKPAYDDVIQGMAGIVGLSATAGGAPAYFPTCIADKTAANIAVQAILAALYKRERTGIGSYVEVPMFETIVSYVLVEHLAAHQFEPPAGEIGYSRYLSPSHRPMRTRDGYVCVRPLTDAHWRGLFAATGDRKAASDPRFATVAARSEHTEELFACLESHLTERSTDDCLTLFETNDIPASRVNGLTDLLRDPHLEAVGHFERLADDKLGTFVYPALGPRFDGANVRSKVPPRLGQHTRDILRQFDYDAATIDRMIAAGIVLEHGKHDTRDNHKGETT